MLGDPEVGDFRVGVSLNEPDHVVRRKLSEFFRDRGRDDLLLLHVSCHGLKDEDGTLYFASANTAVDHLEATAIPSEFVNRQMTKSRSRRIVLLLDCCFGGAFARGLVHRAGESVAIKEEFEGQGRVVLTASRAMEYAFEGDNREGDAQPSIFTSAIVQGLESGEADRDGDSRVSVDELYDYVYDRVRESTPNQTPSKWTFDVHGDLYLARSPFHEPEPVELPVELTAAMESPFANVRAGAVEELARLVGGADARLAAAARRALEALGDDDSKRVTEAAARALGRRAAAPRRAVAGGAAGGPGTPAETARDQAQALVPAARAGALRDVAAQVTLARAAHGRTQSRSAAPRCSCSGTSGRRAGRRRGISHAGRGHLGDLVAARGLRRGAAGRLRRVREPPRPPRTRVRRRPVPRSRPDRARGDVRVRRLHFDFEDTAVLTGVGALATGTAGVLGVLTRRAPEVEVSPGFASWPPRDWFLRPCRSS